MLSRTGFALILNDPSRDVTGAVGTTVSWKHTVRIVREVDSVLRGRVGETRHVCLVGQQCGKAMDDCAHWARFWK